MHQTIYLKIITIITYLLRSIIMTQNILKFNLIFQYLNLTFWHFLLNLIMLKLPFFELFNLMKI